MRKEELIKKLQEIDTGPNAVVCIEDLNSVWEYARSVYKDGQGNILISAIDWDD